MEQKTIVVIPARMASKRFPGKPLAMISGLPMIEHIRRRALLIKGIDEVVVATCDQIIFDMVSEEGGKAVMTSAKHDNSTQRVAEAMTKLSGDVVVVAQGDEPLLLPKVIEEVATPLLGRDELACVSLLSPLESEADYTNANIVKAAINQLGSILYFSRAPIPYFQRAGIVPVYRETGIRAFRADFLQTYISLPPTPFEKAEAVDMLRVLEHGYDIHGVIADHRTIGVDHPEDIEIVEELLRTDPVQNKLHEQIVS